MAKGDKPAIRISARHKNAAKGARVSVDLLAGWDSDRGGMNFQLDREVDRIVMKDGTVITSSDYWINGRTSGSVGGARSSERGTEEGTGTGAPMKDPNDIPF